MAWPCCSPLSLRNKLIWCLSGQHDLVHSTWVFMKRQIFQYRSSKANLGLLSSIIHNPYIHVGRSTGLPGRSLPDFVCSCSGGELLLLLVFLLAHHHHPCSLSAYCDKHRLWGQRAQIWAAPRRNSYPSHHKALVFSFIKGQLRVKCGDTCLSFQCLAG